MLRDIDGATRSILTELLKRCCEAVQSSDCALWLADKDHLHPIMGHGPHSDRFIGQYRHPLSDGLISMVYASGQPFCENNIQSNPQHNSTLDKQLEIQTDAMMVMPLISSGEICGVLTCVHTSVAGEETTPNTSQTFSSMDMTELEFISALAGRVLDSTLLGSVM